MVVDAEGAGLEYKESGVAGAGPGTEGADGGGTLPPETASAKGMLSGFDELRPNALIAARDQRHRTDMTYKDKDLSAILIDAAESEERPNLYSQSQSDSDATHSRVQTRLDSWEAQLSDGFDWRHV